MITHQYEEYKPVGRVWTWLAILLLAVITLSWGMVTHMAVPDVPRYWDFGAVPDAPGESPFSTAPPPRAKAAPPQIELPPDYAGQDVNVP
jgi:hypothetical protein